MSSKFTGYDKSFSELDSKPTASDNIFTKRGMVCGETDGAKPSSEAKPPATTRLDADDINARMKDACLTGQLNVVKDILYKHYSSLTPDTKGRTPLFAACIGNQPDVIECLIKQGFAVNHQDLDGKTPLHVAMEHRHNEALRVLTELDASYTRRDKRHWTAYHSAIDNGFSGFSDTFLQRFLGEDLATDLSWMHLQAASHENKLETVKMLLDNNADVNHVSSAGLTALYIACRENHRDIAECLLRHGSDPNSICKDGETSLHAAVSKQDHNIVQSLLQCPNIDVNIEDAHGNTALHRALTRKESVIVSLLLDHDADIYVQNNRSITPLYAAISQNQSDMIMTLLSKGSRVYDTDNDKGVNATDSDGDSYLHLAIHKGCSLDVVRLILDHGALVNEQNNSLDTPLLLACCTRRDDLIEVLLKAGADPNIADDEGETSLHWAVHKNCAPSIIQLLIDHGANVDAKDKKKRTPLHMGPSKDIIVILLKAGATPDVKYSGKSVFHAVVAGDKQKLQALLDQGEDVNAVNQSGITPLLIACDRNKTEAISILLEAGADPNIADSNGNSALQSAARRCNASILKALISRGADLDYANTKCRTALFYAVFKKHTDAVRVLLEAGADPNIVDDDGDTIIHKAVRVRSSTEVLQMIIEHKAQLDVRNDRGKTALYYACAKQQTDSLRVLLEAGADPNITDNDGDTLLHNAVHLHSDTEVLKMIIGHAVHLDALNKKKDTALQLACDDQQNESASLMIKSGANPNITDRQGNTPLHVVAAHGTKEIVLELLEHGASVNMQGHKNMTPLHTAVCKLQPSDQILDVILPYNPEISPQDNDGDTPLHMATSNRYLYRVQKLLEHSADARNLNGAGRSSFECALHTKDHDLIDAYIKHDPSLVLTVEGCAERRMYYYCEKGKAHLVKLLVECGADMNQPQNQVLPITVAYQKGHHDIVRFLIHAGANVTLSPDPHRFSFLELVYHQRHMYASLLREMLTSKRCVMDLALKNMNGETLLYQACWSGVIEVVQLLLDSNQDIGMNICNPSGKSPLSIACETANTHYHESLTIVGKLLYSSKYPVDMNSVDSEGKSALHRACESDRAMLIHMLLTSSGGTGTINVCDVTGRTPLAYTNNPDIIQLLIQFGAKPDEETK